jgi:hypothetical protein
MNMNKNSTKYLDGINFSQLCLAEKTKIKNLGCATPDLVISHETEYKLRWENLTLLCMLNISGWVAVLKETIH